jgi:hypothetical protein
MGPWSELRQLERKHYVLRLLKQPNLNSWAQDYWTRVLAELSTDEHSYNARVVEVYGKLGVDKLPNDAIINT